jgi:hypothetical protein
MRTHLQVLHEPSTPIAADRPVLYDPVFDEYRLVAAGLMPDRTLIRTCPWCATPLPRSQRERWFAELEHDGLSPDHPALPERFRTDRWWRDQP